MACTRNVEISKLFRKNNVRTEECYQIPRMVESIKRQGFRDDAPIVVHDEGDAGFLVLCGNRRVRAIEWLQEHEPETFAAIFPKGTVPAIIHAGLTEEQKILLRVDHSADNDRVGLDSWSEFLAIRQLVQAFGGDSQSEIAEKLGIFSKGGKNDGQPNRTYVQPRVSLARLPSFVQAEFEKLCRQGADSTPVRWTNVKSLYTIYNREYADFPNGDGPKFSDAWNKIMNPETDEKGNKIKPKSLSAKAAMDRSQAAQSTMVKRALLAATKQGSVDLATVDEQAVRAEQAEQTLHMIREFLGQEAYDSLVADATSAAQKQTETVEA